MQAKNIKLQEELKINDESSLNRRKTDLINEFSGNFDYLIDNSQDKTSLKTKEMDSRTVSENRITLMGQNNLEEDFETYDLQNQENEVA